MTYLAIYLIVVFMVLLINKRAWDFIDPLEPEVRAREIEA